MTWTPSATTTPTGTGRSSKPLPAWVLELAGAILLLAVGLAIPYLFMWFEALR